MQFLSLDQTLLDIFIQAVSLSRQRGDSTYSSNDMGSAVTYPAVQANYLISLILRILSGKNVQTNTYFPEFSVRIYKNT